MLLSANSGLAPLERRPKNLEGAIAPRGADFFGPPAPTREAIPAKLVGARETGGLEISEACTRRWCRLLTLCSGVLQGRRITDLFWIPLPEWKTQTISRALPSQYVAEGNLWKLEKSGGWNNRRFAARGGAHVSIVWGWSQHLVTGSFVGSCLFKDRSMQILGPGTTAREAVDKVFGRSTERDQWVGRIGRLQQKWVGRDRAP